MGNRFTWDEVKRETNLNKHNLDFCDAGWVLDSSYRMDIPVTRNGERRIQSMAYVVDVLAVLLVVHTPRNNTVRVISFRRASTAEKDAYHEWLEEEDDSR